MSMDEAGLGGKPPETAAEPKRKGSRSRPAKTRRYHEITVYKGKVAETLGVLYAAGHTVEFVLTSPDVRGFEIISYTEE
jgi:hypothetical protein